MRTTRRAFLAATAASGLAAPALRAQPAPLRIGVLTDMSGPFSANTGAGSVLAVRMAVEDFGGKVKGRPVDVISADHQNRPDTAVGIAREWFDQQSVSAIADMVNSTVALAVMDVARQKDRITLVGGSGSPAINNEGCTPNNVQLAYDSYATANTVARTLIADGRKRWFFVTADYAFGTATERDATAIIKAAGGTVLGSVRHPPGTTDFSSYLLTAQASGADAVAFASAGSDSVNAIKQSAEFELTGKVALVSLGLVINDVHAIGLNAAQGIYLSEGFYWDRDDASRAFSKCYLKSMSKMPNMVQAGLYSGVTHWLKAHASSDGSTEAVMAAMRATPVDDRLIRGGVVRQDGLMVHDMLLLQVKSPDESKSPWDDLKIVRIVAGNEAFAPLSASRCPAVTK